MGYYFANDGVQQGPFELSALIAAGLKEDSLVWTEGMPDWKRAGDVPETAALFRTRQSAPIPPPPVPQAPVQPQSRPGDVPIAPHQPNWQMQYQTPSHNPNNGMAIASLVLGIVSFPFTLLYCGGIITAILAIIFGLLARAKVRRGEAMSGAGMGLAGIILGVCALIFAVTLLAVVVVLQQGISRGNSGGAGY